LGGIESGDFSIGMDAYGDDQRIDVFAYSQSYASLTPQFFYSRTAFPHGLPVVSTVELGKYRGCGIRGYVYNHYRLAEGTLALSARDYPQLIALLKGGRCDYFPEEFEVMAGYRPGQRPYLDDPQLGHMAIAGAQAPELHFVVARSAPRTAELLAILDRAIEAMQADGAIAALVKEHLARHD
jgi:polar amino acid transport system substrate-binding protein